jgi:hypothetical protein
MDPLSSDTPLDVERIWLDLQRRRGPLWRLRRAVELTSLCWRAAQEAVRRAHPGATRQERDRLLLAHRYGEEIAVEVVRRRELKGFYD